MESESYGYGENEVEGIPLERLELERLRKEILKKVQRFLANMEDVLGTILKPEKGSESTVSLECLHARRDFLKGKLNGLLRETLELPGQYSFTNNQSDLLAKVGFLLSVQDVKEAYKYYMAHFKDKPWN